MSYLLPYTLDTDRVSPNLEVVASKPLSSSCAFCLCSSQVHAWLCQCGCWELELWVSALTLLSDLPGPLGSFLTFFFCPVSPVSSSFPLHCCLSWKVEVPRTSSSLLMGVSPRAQGALSSEATLGRLSVCLPVLFTHRGKQGQVVSLSPQVKGQC